jgi:O-glycosyl hydrolase
MKRVQSMYRIAASLLLVCALAEAQNSVSVDYGQPRQTVAGFGASITWLAGDLNNFSPANQTALLDALYSTSLPSAGLSIIRAGSMLCQFNPSAGVYNWNDPLIFLSSYLLDTTLARRSARERETQYYSSAGFFFLRREFNRVLI